MEQLPFFAANFVLFMHGLIHLMGLAAYWQLAELEELPYKTTMIDGKRDVGDGGFKLFCVLWLVGAIGYSTSVYGLLIEQDWAIPLLWVTTMLSLILTILDWKVAYVGIGFNVAIIIVLIVGPMI